MSVKLNLILEYPIRGEEAPKLGKARRKITEELILGAAHQMFPDGMNRKDLRIFRGVREALDNEDDWVELNKTEFDYLYDLFFSKESEEKVKFRPMAAHWAGIFMDYLEEMRRESNAG